MRIEWKHIGRHKLPVKKAWNQAGGVGLLSRTSSRSTPNTSLQITSFVSLVASLSVSSVPSNGDRPKPDRLRATIPDILLATGKIFGGDSF